MTFRGCIVHQSGQHVPFHGLGRSNKAQRCVSHSQEGHSSIRLDAVVLKHDVAATGAARQPLQDPFTWVAWSGTSITQA